VGDYGMMWLPGRATAWSIVDGSSGATAYVGNLFQYAATAGAGSANNSSTVTFVYNATNGGYLQVTNGGIYQVTYGAVFNEPPSGGYFVTIAINGFALAPRTTYPYATIASNATTTAGTLLQNPISTATVLLSLTANQTVTLINTSGGTMQINGVSGSAGEFCAFMTIVRVH
jgi:hypothetical protein